MVQWRSLKWFHADLKKFPRESLNRLKSSLIKNNFIQPFNVWDTGQALMILDGQYRQKAMQSLEKDGYEIPDELPANFIECRSRTEAAKLVLLYSSIYADATVDGLEALLHDYAISIDDIRFDVDLANFRFDEFIKSALADLDKATCNLDEVPALPAEPITRPGDLYELGPHRLLCGDATDLSHARRLFGNDLASMVFTDPPYGVSYKAPCGKFEIITNDDKTDDDLVNSLLLPSFKTACTITVPDAAFYIWHASSTRDDFAYAMKAAGLLERQYIIWAKPGFILGHADYRWAHEPCYYASKDGRQPQFFGNRSQPTVWRISLRDSIASQIVLGSGIQILDGSGGKIFIEPKSPKGKKIRKHRIAPGETIYIATGNQLDDLWEVGRDGLCDHPTQKPVELATRAIENSSLPGDIIYDGFLGSGTTLIASETTGRRCYGTELEPQYCDVIVDRYVKMVNDTRIRKNGAVSDWRSG